MLNEFISIPPRERVIVALDCAADEALRLADALEGRAPWAFLGMSSHGVSASVQIGRAHV